MSGQITEEENGQIHFEYCAPFTLENGQSIEPLNLVCETYGKLSSKKDNAILIHHALSTNSHIASHEKNTKKGWWESMVGPDKPIDTNKYHVICINNLGSCFGSSGPTSINQQTGKIYGSDFPTVHIIDMVRSQKLLLNHLGIEKLTTIIGNSMGAMLSLQMAIEYPDLANKLISVSSCYRSYPMSIAYHTIQKEIIKLDPDWQQGHYQQQPTVGLQIARKIGLLSYRAHSNLNERFKDDGDIREYLDYNANKFTSGFDTNTYLYLLEAMDEFDVTNNYDDKEAAFKRIRAKTLVISVDSDELYPPVQQEELYDSLKNNGVDVQFFSLSSDYGHDAFYADENIAHYINNFL